MLHKSSQGRSRNRQTGHWRTSWANLDEPQRKKRYQQAVLAYRNGIKPSDPGTFAEFARAQRALDAFQPPPPKTVVRRNQKPPPFFGSVARTEILLLLAVNGPLHVREIARLRCTDASSTFRAVERLQSAGLVAKRSHGKRVVALDRSHRAYTRLKQFLLELAKHFPQPRIDVPYRHGLPLRDDAHTVANEDNLFGQVAKTRALLGIAALEPLNVMDLTHAVQMPHNITWHAVEALESDDLIVSERIGRDRILRLNNMLPAFDEFRGYLQTLIATERPEYKDTRMLLARARRRKVSTLTVA